MKKSLLIIGMFSLMMVLTSFTAPNETGGGKSTELQQLTDTGGGGGKSTTVGQ